jgi:3-hydroxyisobutyrate dehydrogenase
MKGKVAFVGLGKMGLPMAKNLVLDGWSVHGYDVVPACRQALDEVGGVGADSVEAILDAADFCLSMLQNGEQVRELYVGKNAVFKRTDSSCVHVDCSTIAPSDAQYLHSAALELGKIFLDCPVSGGVAGAEAGRLSFLAGGEAAHVDAVHELLMVMGSAVFHAGPGGSGQAAKLCNNMLLAITMIGSAEAISLGQKLGLDPKILSKIMCNSSGRNWCLDTYNPVPGIMEGVPASNGYAGGFTNELMCKDLGLAIDAANHSGATTSLGALAWSLYRLWSQGEGSGLDFSSIYKMLSDDE